MKKNIYLPTYLFNTLLLVLLNILVLLKVPIVSGIAGFIYLFWLPGHIILSFFTFDADDFWLKLLYKTGLSISFVEISGIATNTILPLFGETHPLYFNNVIVFFDIILLVFLLLNIIFSLYNPRLVTINFSLKRVGLFVLPLCYFPIIAILGATYLNNGGDNRVVMLLNISIVVYVLYLFINNQTVTESVFIRALISISLSLLLMTSMRGWHIIGYDIHQEFEVFQLTKKVLFWKMSALQDPYNACMSITILPTITSQFVNIQDEYIYKFLYQILFSFMSIVIYFIVRIFEDKKKAFLASFFIISQIWFFSGMPTLIRQEFALLFFGLIVLTLFNPKLDGKTKYILATIFGLSMILSHYSTSYIATSLFVIVYTLMSLFKLFSKRIEWIRSNAIVNRVVTLPYLLFLIISVVIWNGKITHTSGGFVKFLDYSVTRVGQVFNYEVISNAINQLFYLHPQKVNIETYISQNTDQFQKDWPYLQYYNETANEFTPKENDTFSQVPQRLGENINKLALKIFTLQKVLINNVFILTGFVVMLVMFFKGKFKNIEFIFLCCGGFVLLALLLLIPDALKEYNIERLYFQLLIVWALMGVYGGSSILNVIRLPDNNKIIILAIYCTLLLYNTGFIFSFTGGPSLISMNSYGEEYEKFYTHEAEVRSANWLGEHFDNTLIYTSSPGRNKLWAFGNISTFKMITNTLPGVISKNAYVYLTYINTIGGKGLYVDNGTTFLYPYPQEFLNENKNEIYSNGISAIYH